MSSPIVRLKKNCLRTELSRQFKMDSCFLGCSDSEQWQNYRSLEVLPIELLVYILSLLPTLRDKLKFRYVSRRLRTVTKTPSLWSEFTWPHFDRREELSLMSILKACGHHVKRLIFPDHVTPSKLITMVSLCKNVTQISLPPKTKINPGELRKAVQQMQYLEKLDVQIKDDNIEPLLLDGLKELTLHNTTTASDDTTLLSWIQQWVGKGFVPSNLNVVKQCGILILYDLVHEWPKWNANPSNSYMANFRLYDSCKVPLNISYKFPVIQLEFGQKASLPFATASGVGILGLGIDVLLLTNHNLGDKVMHKVAVRDIRTSINLLKDMSFVTDFDIGGSNYCYPGHLEQIAIACPNLQRLNLSGNQHCLENMDGVQKLVQCCQDLRGLNLLDIPFDNVHYSVRMFEVLSGLRLTHLAVEMCVLKPSYHLMRGNGNEMYLLYVFNKFSSLQAIEYHQNVKACTACEFLMECEFVFLPEFTSLKYCNVSEEDPYTLMNILTRCEEVTCLRCEVPFLDLPSTCICSLQQLCIVSRETEITDTFVDAVSGRGTLVHVVLGICDIETTGITHLIANSHSLITLCIYASMKLQYEDGTSVVVQAFKSSLKEKFCSRKLFTCGKFKLQQEHQSSLYLSNILQDTDLLSLWP